MSVSNKISFLHGSRHDLVSLVMHAAQSELVEHCVDGNASISTKAEAAVDALLSAANADIFSMIFASVSDGAASNVPAKWVFRSTTTLQDIDVYFDSIARRTRWCLFPWGDPGGMGCLAWITKRTTHEDYVACNPLLSGQPGVEWNDRMPFHAGCRALLFDEDRSGRALWRRSRGKIRVAVWASLAEPFYQKCEGPPHLVEGPFLGCGPLAIVTPGSGLSFTGMCRAALAKNAWMVCVPESVSIAKFSHMMETVYKQSFLQDIQLLGDSPWVFTAGRSIGDRAHLFFASRSSNEVVKIAESKGILLLSAF